MRKSLQDGSDNGYDTHAPFGSFTGADVWVMDFSNFTRPGEYRLFVDRIGCSYPFRIDDDVYREAFYTTIRALYLQRCGVALEEPYTQWTRPRCHHPAETDTVILSNWRYMDGGNAFTQLPQYATNVKKPFWGGWHDAADWDRNAYHLNTCQLLLLAYELRPENFSDDELNIPESGNGLPDILDEALWGVDFFKRMQENDGGIHGGIETWRHPAPGESCVTETDQWYAYAPDPQVSFHYAAVACQMAYCLELAGHPEFKTEYIASARKAYDWAANHILPGDETKVRDARHHAAAWLFRITGETQFQDQFKKDNVVKSATTELEIWDSHDQQWGVWTYVMANQPGIDQSLKSMLAKAVEYWAYADHILNADRRGYRYGNDWWYPVVSGNATRPNIFPLMAAYAITGNEKYLSYCYTTADYILGANPLNMCWVSGIGEKYPVEFMHIDSWFYNTEKGMVPGIIPYGPYWYEEGVAEGPWDPRWGKTTTYPDAKLWPSHELWFENRYCPPTNEFTVHESIGTAAAAFGFLSKPGGKFTSVEAEKSSAKSEYRLLQNYPNPFNPTTTIEFSLPATERVEVVIFDISGRKVATLLNEVRRAGKHVVSWEGKDERGILVSTGVYLCVVESSRQIVTRKMLMLR
ncbi:MAG: glycoside hydrolase family 9 protein [Anaerolineae bacterium]|nr:glycoside hydrolase family 9 protein [Anaerolineae bacterium]